MKNYYPTLLGMLATTMLNAQFSIEFTPGEGYADGKLGLNSDWQVWDGTGKDPNTFTVNAESGYLLIDPTESGFQVAAYAGAGSQLTSNTYYVVAGFRLVYPEGSSPTIGEQPAVLPVFEIQNTTDNKESAGFGLRQVKASGASQFNIFTVNKFNGSPDPAFSNLFNGESLGLAVDSSGKWTDGTSDVLALLYSIILKDEKNWVEKILLVNIETSKEIATFSRTVKDADNSFAENAGRFRIYPLFMDSIEGAVRLESITLNVAKE